MKLNSKIRNLLTVVVPVVAVIFVAGNAYAAEIRGPSQQTVTPAARGTHVRQQRFFGTVTAISPGSWVVGGQTFVITASTQIATGINTGDTVKVVYYISGTDEIATKIALVSAAPTLVSYSGIIQPILDANCVSCHGNGYAAAGINLSTYSNTAKYVTPYDASGSVLYQSLSTMPIGGSLSSTDRQSIADWINQGALNN